MGLANVSTAPANVSLVAPASRVTRQLVLAVTEAAVATDPVSLGSASVFSLTTARPVRMSTALATAQISATVTTAPAPAQHSSLAGIAVLKRAQTCVRATGPA